MTKLKTIPWKNGLKLADLTAGTVVTGVPINHNMFKGPLERGLKACLANWSVFKRVNEMLQYDQMLPVYYCLDCGQIEDGRHRMLATKIYDRKKIDIMLWARCYKKSLEVMQALENSIIAGETTL